MKAMKKDSDHYAFNKDHIKNLRDRILLSDEVKYKKEPASNRHRGITPMMKSVFNVLHKAMREANKEGKIFLGLSLFDFQEAFKACSISNDTVRDNVVVKLYKQFKFLKRRVIKKTEKTSIPYYSFNYERHPCKDGVFVLFPDKYQTVAHLWIISCPIYPFCTCNAIDCILPSILVTLRDMLTDNYIDQLKGMDEVWENRMASVKRISEEEVVSLLIKEGDKPELVEAIKDINPTERESIAESIYEARKEQEEDGNMDAVDEEIDRARSAIRKLIKEKKKRFVLKKDVETVVPPVIEEKRSPLDNIP